MIIAYYHLPEHELPDYCRPTQTWVYELERQGYRIVDIETPRLQDKMYEETLKIWGKDDLVIVGQDNVGTIPMLEHFESCPHLFCANPCLVDNNSLGFAGLKLNMISDGVLHDVNDRSEFATGYCGTGLCRLRKELQLDMDIIKNKFHHQSMDSAFSNLARPMVNSKFHLHYPLHSHMKVEKTYKEELGKLNHV